MLVSGTEYPDFIVSGRFVLNITVNVTGTHHSMDHNWQQESDSGIVDCVVLSLEGPGSPTHPLLARSGSEQCQDDQRSTFHQTDMLASLAPIKLISRLRQL